MSIWEIKDFWKIPYTLHWAFLISCLIWYQNQETDINIIHCSYSDFISFTRTWVCVCVCLLCCVLCLVTQSCPTLWTVADPWTVAHQAPLSIRILQARILSGSPCPPCVCVSVSSVQSLSRVWLFGTLWTPWTAAVYVFSSMQFYNMCFLSFFFFFERKKPPDYRLLEF